MDNPIMKEINEKLLNDILNNDFETFGSLFEFYFRATEQLKEQLKGDSTDIIQQFRHFIVSLVDDRQFYQVIRKQIFMKNIQNDVRNKHKDKENKSYNYMYNKDKDNKFISEASLVESFELFNDFLEDKRKNSTNLNNNNNNYQTISNERYTNTYKTDFQQNQYNDFESRHDMQVEENRQQVGEQPEKQEKFTRWKQCSYGDIDNTLQTDFNQSSYENCKKEWLQMIYQQNQVQKSVDSQQFIHNFDPNVLKINNKIMNNPMQIFSFPSYSQSKSCFSFPQSITINSLQQFIDYYNKSEQSIFYVSDSFEQFRFDLIKNTIYSDFGKQHLEVLRKYMNRESMVIYKNKNRMVSVKQIENEQFRYRVEIVTQNVGVRVQGINCGDVVEIKKEYSRGYDGFIVYNRQMVGIFPLTMADLIEPLQIHPQKLRELYRQNKVNCLISRVRTLDVGMDVEQYFNPYYTIQDVENVQKIMQLARFCQIQFIIRVYIFRKTHFCVKVCQLDQQINKQMAEQIINSLLFIWNNQYQ